MDSSYRIKTEPHRVYLYRYRIYPVPLNTQDKSNDVRPAPLDGSFFSPSLPTPIALALDADEHLFAIDLMAFLIAFRRRDFSQKVDRQSLVFDVVAPGTEDLC